MQDPCPPPDAVVSANVRPCSPGRGFPHRAKPIESFRVAIFDSTLLRAPTIVEGLREAGISDITHIAGAEDILAEVDRMGPDIVFFAFSRPSNRELEKVFEVSRAALRPVALFVDETNTSIIRSALEAGVSEFVIDGLTKSNICHFIVLCISRFEAFCELKLQIERTEAEIKERILLDDATHILMEALELDEDGAAALMRRRSDEERKSVNEIAKSVIAAWNSFR
jgi:two-component system, response regulator / RNA-binding antiterminator